MLDLPDLLAPGARLVRDDLAEQALEGLVRARAYALPTRAVCQAPVAAVCDAPGGLRIDELLMGEGFDVLAAEGDWSWGRARRDGVIGWIATSVLTEASAPPAWRVRALSATLRGAPEASALPLAVLSMNALVAVGEVHDGFLRVGDGWLALDDLARIGDFEPDLLSMALRFLGAPHVLGGRTGAGTDCSGLVQQALYACGLPGPRYGAEQAELGERVSARAAARGDLVVWLARRPDDVWTGHCGLLAEADRVLHASGSAGSVLVEPLDAVDARYRASGFSAAKFRRLDL